MSACKVVTLLHGFTCFYTQCWDTFYHQHMSLYIFFTPLNYASSLPNASIVNAQFIFQFICQLLTYRNLMRTSLMASSFTHNGQIQSLHNQNLAPWPKTAFDVDQILFATFYFIFWGQKFWGDKTLVDLLTFKCKEQILFYERASATVIQPKTGVLNLLSWTPSRVWWNLLTPSHKYVFKYTNYTDRLYI